MRPTVLALTNATGRQASSLARAASAVGYRLRAHVASRAHSPLVAEEIAALPYTTIVEGPLTSPDVVAQLFQGADLAFINTTYWDFEQPDGKRCIDAARKAGIRHVVYSSMPDHSDGPGNDWIGLPHYLPKGRVEKYIRTLDIPTTFVYTGIYHNNFTSQPFPLFCLREAQWSEVEEWPGEFEDDWVPSSDGKRTPGRKCGFEWQAPFPSNVRLPWLDSEHDVGPAILQLFKEGPQKWAGKRVPLAFDFLDPPAVCAAFSRALKRPVRYIEGPVEVQVPIPKGYREQLEALQSLLGSIKLGGQGAPYWWKGLFDIDSLPGAGRRRSTIAAGGGGRSRERRKVSVIRHAPKPEGVTSAIEDDDDDGDNEDNDDDDDDDENANDHRNASSNGHTSLLMDEAEEDELLMVARALWPGWRDLEGYAREVFPVEERLNQRTWMDDESDSETSTATDD